MAKGKLKEIVDNYYSDKTIELPENPYIQFGKKLGRDELYAAALSTSMTALVGIFIDSFTGFSLALRSTIISIAGPVAEKPGLFFHYFKESIKEYHNTPKLKRKSKKYYFKKIMKDGWPTLRADILFHDSMYFVLMWGVSQMFKPTGFELAIVSLMVFMTALLFATTLEVNYIELKYKLQKRKLLKKGFKLDNYYETRFRVYPTHKNHSPKEVLKYLAKSFDLPIVYSGEYHDVYLQDLKLLNLNGRAPLLRFRSRTHLGKKNGLSNSLQITYTKPSEFLKKDIRSFRCFPVIKDKFYYEFNKGKMYWDYTKIPNKKIAQFVKKVTASGNIKKVNFKRMIARDPKTILISVDELMDSQKDFYVIELKIRKDLKTFRAVNDFILRNLPAEGTTFSKFKLL